MRVKTTGLITTGVVLLLTFSIFAYTFGREEGQLGLTRTTTSSTVHSVAQFKYWYVSVNPLLERITKYEDQLSTSDPAGNVIASKKSLSTSELLCQVPTGPNPEYNHALLRYCLATIQESLTNELYWGSIPHVTRTEQSAMTSNEQAWVIAFLKLQHALKSAERTG